MEMQCKKWISNKTRTNETECQRVPKTLRPLARLKQGRGSQWDGPLGKSALSCAVIGGTLCGVWMQLTERLAWKALLEVALPGLKGRCKSKTAPHYRLRAGKPTSSIGLCRLTSSPADLTFYQWCEKLQQRDSRATARSSFVTHRVPDSTRYITRPLLAQELQEKAQHARPVHRIFPKWAHVSTRAWKSFAHARI